MNRLWISVFLSAVASLILALLALFSALAQLLQLSASTLNFLPLGNFSSLLYLTSISILSAWASHLILKNIVDSSQPLSLNTIKSYICMAKDAGLLSESQVKILTECSQFNKSKYGIIRSGDGEESCEQQIRDEFQCELELLLNELHRLLIASWFDSVSPQDPEFPRATRQALARASVELQLRASSIKPYEAVRIILTLANSHLSKVESHQYNKRLSPLEDGSAAQVLSLISDALVSSLLPPEVGAPPGGELLASLLAHGALRRALSLVSSPGWLATQLAQAITGESLTAETDVTVSQASETPVLEADNTVSLETLQSDADAEAVQEACTPLDDTPELIAWPSECGNTPKLWGTCSLQPEQPSLPQIVEPRVKGGAMLYQPVKKASEAEWLDPSPTRQHLGLQLSKSSQDLSQVSSSSYARDICLNEDLKIAKFSTLPATSSKELSLGSFMREETSIFGNKMREAGSDVLGSLRARASSHLSALLSPARESPPPPPPPQLPIEFDEEDDAVSPVYEEASDLASSIAKLRALLQHHEHKSSTDEEELTGHSTEDLTTCDGDGPPSLDHVPQDSPIVRPMWELHPEVENSETDWMEAEEAPELPDDGRPFMNISIPATELSCDTSGQQFVQYCIQYDAVYVQESEDGPRLVLQTTSVKRRFQEFLNLQNRLEENPMFRSALKGVKGPSRWLSLAFSKAGQQTTAMRLPVLERFLQQLCEQPVLARSPALRHFLAYGSQRTIAFTKQGSDLPRLDKILARTVSGVFHSIKTALPSFDFELSPAGSLQQLQHASQWGEESQMGRTSSLPGFLGLVGGRPQPRPNQPLVFMEKIPQGRDLAKDIQKFLAARVEPASEALSEDSVARRKVSVNLSPLSAIQPTDLPKTKPEPLAEFSLVAQQQSSLSSLFEELLVILLQGSWVVTGPLPFAIRTILQEWTEERLQVVADYVWSLNSAVLCLRLCRAALAPGASVLRTSKEEGQAALKSALRKSTPAWLQLMIGATSMHNAQARLTNTLTEEQANQHLALNVALTSAYLLLTAQPTQQISPSPDCSL